MWRCRKSTCNELLNVKKKKIKGASYFSFTCSVLLLLFSSSQGFSFVTFVQVGVKVLVQLGFVAMFTVKVWWFEFSAFFSKSTSFMGFLIKNEVLFIVFLFSFLLTNDFCEGFRVFMFEYFCYLNIWCRKRVACVFILNVFSFWMLAMVVSFLWFRV